jgi:hypothetical protein
MHAPSVTVYRNNAGYASRMWKRRARKKAAMRGPMTVDEEWFVQEVEGWR